MSAAAVCVLPAEVLCFCLYLPAADAVGCGSEGAGAEGAGAEGGRGRGF